MSADGPLLEVASLRVTYGGVTAVDDVTLSVGPGQIYGLIGPNGAGKTSFIDAITGYTPPSGGTVRFRGRDVTRDKPHRRARSGLTRTFQSVELFDDLTVRENLTVASSSVTFASTMRDLVRRHRSQDDQAIDDALTWCGLQDVAHDSPTSLSHGRRKLVGVARALAPRPALVLLDEPAAGLDTDESARLGDQLRQLPARGVSVLLVDHDMSLVMAVCDEIMVIDFGRTIAQGTPQQIRTSDAVVEAYLGTS